MKSLTLTSSNELDLQRITAKYLRQSRQFLQNFAACIHPELKNCKLVSVTENKMDFDRRETDIAVELALAGTPNVQAMILIEVKLSAKFGVDQVAAYQERVRVYKQTYAHAFCVLVAPKEYPIKHTEAAGFDSFIDFGKILQWIQESGNDDLITKLDANELAKINAKPFITYQFLKKDEPNLKKLPAIQAFEHEYKEFSKTYVPNYTLRNITVVNGGYGAQFLIPEYKPVKDVNLNHVFSYVKSARGRIWLYIQFAASDDNAIEVNKELFEKLKEAFESDKLAENCFTIRKTDYAVSIENETVLPVQYWEPFESQRQKVTHALELLKQLGEWAQQVYEPIVYPLIKKWLKY